MGTTNDYFIAQDWDMAIGRTFDAAEERGRAALHPRRDGAFSSSSAPPDPTGQQIRVGKVSCSDHRRPWPSAASPEWATTRTTSIIMPVKVYQRRVGGKANANVQMIVISARDGVSTIEGSGRNRKPAARARARSSPAAKMTSASTT